LLLYMYTYRAPAGSESEFMEEIKDHVGY
jgi:hypothetical protein